MSSRRVTSVTTASAPRAAARAATSANSSRRRAASASRCPWPLSSRASAAPIPPLAPVMTMTFRMTWPPFQPTQGSGEVLAQQAPCGITRGKGRPRRGEGCPQAGGGVSPAGRGVPHVGRGVPLAGGGLSPAGGGFPPMGGGVSPVGRGPLGRGGVPRAGGRVPLGGGGLFPGRGQHGPGSLGMEGSIAAVHLQNPFEPQDRPPLDLVFGLVVGARPLVPGAVAAVEAEGGVAARSSTTRSP